MSFIQITVNDHIMTYQTADTALARYWQQWVTDHNPSLRWGQFHEVTVYTDQDPQSVITAQLDQLCAQMNLSYRDLNDLHQQFQTAEEQGRGGDQWRKINGLIHDLEEARAFPDPREPRALIKFYMDQPQELPQIPLALRPWWQHTVVTGDLRLGYHTIGKTLWHCCRDRDTGAVLQGLIRPQETISTELLMYFGPTETITNTDKHQQIQRWLRDHNLEDHVDLDDPRYQYHGQPLIARLIDPQPSEVLRWLRPYHRPQSLQIFPVTSAQT